MSTGTKVSVPLFAGDLWTVDAINASRALSSADDLGRLLRCHLTPAALNIIFLLRRQPGKAILRDPCPSASSVVPKLANG